MNFILGCSLGWRSSCIRLWSEKWSVLR